jgi:hypothetical protein
MKLVYIGDHTSRFTPGLLYKVINTTLDFTTVLDKDGVPMDFISDHFHYYFRWREINKWRDEQIDKILN